MSESDLMSWAQFGFSGIIAIYVLVRLEKQMKELTTAVVQLVEIARQAAKGENK